MLRFLFSAWLFIAVAVSVYAQDGGAGAGDGQQADIEQVELTPEDVAAEPDPPTEAQPLPADDQLLGDKVDPNSLTIVDRAIVAMHDFWHFTLFTVGEQRIRVSQVAVALLVVLVGLIISRLVTRRLYNYLTGRRRISDNAAAVIERLTYYLLAMIIGLFALKVVQVPLTIFAFLGGAVAIGIGFGAQAIFNNFISGLILMVERPIRIGDTLEVDDHVGKIQEIGARCTRMRRSDGIDLLIPNSKLLENNVINWTLKDKHVRTFVAVGVAYGSPTDKVGELVRQAVDEQPRVMKSPKPIILFDTFGDNALGFEAHFWVEADTLMQLREIQSDVRYRIDALFRESDITIAFPQRDVHMDTLSPLKIELINPH